MNESELSHRAAEEALPLREAFAVLFFVSVGMQVDPGYFLEEPLRVAAAVAIVVVGKGLTAVALVAVLRRPLAVGLVVAAGLAQIGKFSFIIAELGAHSSCSTTRASHSPSARRWSRSSSTRSCS